MTYSDALSRGGGTLELFLRVDGFPYVFGTASSAPTDSWYTTEGYSYHRGLRTESIRLGCTARPGEVWPDTRGCDVEVDDSAAVLAPLLQVAESLGVAELTETLSAAATTIAVDDTSDFASSGTVYLGQEAIAYTGTTATSFTGCTRGYFGSLAQEHVYDLNGIPAVVPECYDGPADMRGRRCVLYAAETLNGTLSATEQVWVGYVSGYADWIQGAVRFPIDHAVKAFAYGKVFGWVPQGRLRGLYIPNYPGLRWGRMTLSPETTAGGGAVDLDIVADGTAEFFASVEDLVDEWITAVNALTDWRAGVTPDGGLCWVQYIGSASASTVYGSARESLSELLGFCGRDYDGGYLDIRDTQYIAPYAPATMFTSIVRHSSGYEPRLYLRSGEAQYFRESYARLYVDGNATRPAKIYDIDTVNDYLVVDGVETFDETSDILFPGEIYMRGEGAAPMVRQVWGLDEFRIEESIRLLWGGQTYAGASAVDYTVPLRWLAGPHMRDADVDWTGLYNLCRSLPDILSKITYAIEEPTEVSKVLTAALITAGVYAYVENDGTVSWRRTELPNLTEADTAIDTTYVDATRAPKITTLLGRDKLLNAVHLMFETGGETWPNPRSLFIVDQRSLQRYGASHARDLRDPTAGIKSRSTELKLNVHPGYYARVFDEQHIIAQHVATGLMRLLAVPRSAVTLPVTPKARAVAIGDAVLLSSTWVYDAAAGSQSVASKLCLVVGWSRDYGLSGRNTDYLELILIDDPPGAIAPAAKATAWNSGAKQLTFADTTLYKRSADTSDLSYLEAGDAVRIYDHDDESPTVWTAEVASVDVAGKTMTLDSAPAIAVPCVVTLDEYDQCNTALQAEGWIWIGDDDDGDVQDLRTAYRWG